MNISKIIKTTKEVLGDYYISTLTQRLSGGAGSCYEQFNTIDELEKALLSVEWEEINHPDVMQGCRCFKANLEGRYGLISLSSLTDDATLIADDRKNTGKVSIAVEGVRGEIVPDTYLISGIHEGKEVLFTFHPGEPVPPSIIDSKIISHGEILSKQKAINLGFNLAKIV